MVLLLKTMSILLTGSGIMLFAWNYKAADEGDKKAKKYTVIGVCLLLASCVLVAISFATGII